MLEKASNIIHAGGVRGVVISSALQARGVLSYHPRRRRVGVWDFVALGESAARLDEASDPVAQILEVRWFDAQFQHFFDHRREVGQGTNRA
jgi:hypothetical protein